MAGMGLFLSASLILIAVTYGTSEDSQNAKVEVKSRVKRHMGSYGYMPNGEFGIGGQRVQSSQAFETPNARGPRMHDHAGLGIRYSSRQGLRNVGGPGMRYAVGRGMRNGGGHGMRYGGGLGIGNGRGPRMRNDAGPGMRDGRGQEMYHGGYGHYHGHGYGMHHGRGYGCHGRHHWGGHGPHQWGGHGMHPFRDYGIQQWQDGHPHDSVFPSQNSRPRDRGYGLHVNEGNFLSGGTNYPSNGNNMHHREDYLGFRNHGLTRQGMHESGSQEDYGWMTDLDPRTGMPRLSVNEQRKVNFLLTAQNHFTVTLNGQIGSPATDIVYSPYGIFQSLTMMYIGSRTHTAFQMRRVLHLVGMGRHVHHPVRYQNILLSHPGTAVLEMTTILMVKPEVDVSEAFHERLESSYEAQVSHFDLTHENEPEAAVNQIVSEQTHAQIPRILNPGVINETTDMVLLNAMFFKAKWKIPFVQERTSSETFMKTATQQTVVQMMRTEDSFKMGTVQGHAARVLELPYEDNRFSMLVILPDDVAGLAPLENDLTAEILTTSLDAALPARVNVSLPKFRLDTSLSLKEKLQNMGMTKAFDARFSDFRGIAINDSLHITDIIHRAIVVIDEEGSEETPTTPAAISESSNMPPISDFLCDHPFLFIIRDNVSKVNLFVGKFSGGL